MIDESKITVKEPGAIKKFVSGVFKGDFRTVGAYLLNDLLKPTLRDMGLNALHSTIDILFGDGSSKYSKYSSSSSKVRTSYSKSSTSTNSNSAFVASGGTMTTVLKEITFENYSDADEILNMLCEKIDKEGCASVADYYEYCKQKSDWTDHQWGWNSLASARSRRVNGGYVINLPRPVRL